MNSELRKTPTQKPDYGIDAPGVRLGMLIAGIGGLALASVPYVAQIFFNVTNSTTAFIFASIKTIGLLIAAYGLYMGAYMTYGSRVGKLRTRDLLLEHVESLKPCQGTEAVLDVGCGRGLMMIGAAKRLIPELGGLAVGVDLWRTEDQSFNTPAATMDNARLEGVADRVRVDTGDARRLPYDDNSFDVVLSHWVIHNLESQEDRLKALDEMLRVLRSGGVIALADIAGIAAYKAHLQARNITGLRYLDGGIEASVMGLLSGGTYRPQALIALCL